MDKTIILGAGLAGLSVSYHLGHENCLLLERNAHPYGHIKSSVSKCFTWDQGPHVSFTKHQYVRNLFAASVQGEYEEFDAQVSNFFHGSWITHPAQVSLHQVPEPLRSRCLASFLQSRSDEHHDSVPVANYQEWLERAFGPVFACTFPAAYTRKYWTREPRYLTTDWVGERVHYPTIKDVLAGANGPIGRNAHYVTRVRYPKKGGYQSFAQILRVGADIRFGVRVMTIDLGAKHILLVDGTVLPYKQLISTIPLPEFVGLCSSVPQTVLDAIQALDCSELLLVNVTAKHTARRPETWFYVYDEEKLSTRIHCTEHLTAGNVPSGCTGLQIEIYSNRKRPINDTSEAIIARIKGELGDMGLVDVESGIVAHSMLVPWANVIFNHDTKPALATIWSWLEEFGLKRESDDLHPLTDWTREPVSGKKMGCLAFAGRYGQWKYFWTDDCVLRGRWLSQK